MANSENTNISTKVPRMLYGTAWKEQQTERHVLEAVNAGFRGIDTANQRKHYYEEGVGNALLKLYAQEGFKREDFFLQTKFTPLAGHDYRLPYDNEASRADQVRQSFENSLQHLQTDYLDSYILHGPTSSCGLCKTDWFTWEVMTKLYQQGRVKRIGVSNMNFEQLKELTETSETAPHFIQNRCFARTGWDRQVREYCLDKGIVYQGFSLLTANPDVLQNLEFQKLAQQKDLTPAQLVLTFALKVKMLPLTGTTDPQHMQQDLDCLDKDLDDASFEIIESLIG